jgi:hypothetical protein
LGIEPPAEKPKPDQSDKAKETKKAT